MFFFNDFALRSGERVYGSSWISPFTLDLIAAFTTISKKNITWYILVYLPRLLGLLAKLNVYTSVVTYIGLHWMIAGFPPGVRLSSGAGARKLQGLVLLFLLGTPMVIHD
jgi:hypothetical protein